MRDAAAPVAALLELLRARRKGDVSGLALRGETDWQRLVEAASVHGVAPLLHRQLGSLGVGDRVPRAARMGLEDAYHCNRLRNAVLWELLAEILTAFRRAGLGCIVLKGPHLAEAIYGDAGLRPIRDFDLLVRREEETAARDVLRRSGWHQRSAGHDDASHHHAAPFRRPGLLPVELHRRLGRGFDEETTDGMWKRSETRDFGGAPAGVLAPADLLLHLCVHATLGHRLRIPILSLVDVASLVRRRGTDVDWGSLASTANRAGVGRYVYTTLRVAESTLAAGIPPHVADALRHTEQDETMVDVIRHYLTEDAPPPTSLFRGLYRRCGLGQRIRLVLRSWFPSGTTLARLYGVRRHTAGMLIARIRRASSVTGRAAGLGAQALLGTRAYRHRHVQRLRWRDVDRWLAPDAYPRRRSPPESR